MFHNQDAFHFETVFALWCAFMAFGCALLACGKRGGLEVKRLDWAGYEELILMVMERPPGGVERRPCRISRVGGVGGRV